MNKAPTRAEPIREPIREPIQQPYAPWRGGEGGVRMGLTPLAPDLWLCRFPDQDERLAARWASYQRNPDAVYAEQFMAATASACERVRDLVHSHIGTAWRAYAGITTLVECALNTAEDLCVLNQDSSGEYVLTAAAVFAPSFWRLADKIGRPLSQIHAPVANLEQTIGGRLKAFLAKLPAERIFTRGNWHLHTTDELFRDTSDDFSESSQWTPVNIADRLFVRTEQQTLRRLDAHSLLFTILPRVTPLRELAAFPHLLSDILLAYQRMPPAERTQRHVHRFERALTDWIKGIG